MKILVAEDEPDMQKILQLYLAREGYEVFVAGDGEQALHLLCKEPFDLLIADWMMPGLDGIALCKEVRSYSLPVKIILLTAKGQAQDEIEGLMCGADDYMKKPFEPKILLLRIRKLFQLDDALQCGALRMDDKTKAVYLGPEELRLTQKELLLLRLFLLNKGTTLTRELLLERVWGSEYDGDERTLDTHIRRLRAKIGREYIATFVGLGYRMEEPHE